MTLTELAANHNGELPAYAWPGGYPILYLDHDSEVLCAKCATKALLDTEENERSKPQAFDVYYEGPDEHCAECNAVIESAYGDPEVEEAKDQRERESFADMKAHSNAEIT